MTDLMVRLTRKINAPIERVFDAWLNPAMLEKFILPAGDMPPPEVTNDPREGGRFTIVMHVGEDRLPHTGTYRIIDRPHRLGFSWESAYSTDDSEVRLDFRALGDDSTEVELIHVRFLHEQARTDHEGGWGNILDKLAQLF